MKNYQALQEAMRTGTLTTFAKSTVASYVSSKEYLTMQENDKYFGGENPFLSQVAKDVDIGGNDLRKIKVSSEFLKLIVTHVVNRLWFYPVNFDTVENGQESIYNKLGGDDFQNTAKDIATFAAVHGVCYGFWGGESLQMFKATEFMWFACRNTSKYLAGLRFWTEADGTQVFQLFEVDGWQEWRLESKSSTETITIPKAPYIQHRYTNQAGADRLVGGENFGVLPIIPMYVNANKSSENTPAIKSKINLYDALWTSYGDDILAKRFLYWIIQGLGGDAEALQNLIKTAKDTGILAPDYADDVNVDAKILDIPFESHMANLEQLEREIYRDAQIMHPASIVGGSLTNVAIKTNQSSENVKIAGVERYAREFIRGLLKVAGFTSRRVEFKHHTVSNDDEISKRIVALIDRVPEAKEVLLELEPLISPEMLERILDASWTFDVGMDGMGDMPEIKNKDEVIRLISILKKVIEKAGALGSNSADGE